MPDLNERIEGILDKAFAMAPEQARAIANAHVQEISTQSSHNKEQLIRNLKSIPYSKAVIEPLIYADEEKWYGLSDAAYLIYRESMSRGHSSTLSWMLANAFLLGNVDQHLLQINTKGSDLQKIIDNSISSPFFFLIKYFLLSIVKYGVVVFAKYKAYQTWGTEFGGVNYFTTVLVVWILWATFVAEMKMIVTIMKENEPKPADEIPE